MPASTPPLLIPSLGAKGLSLSFDAGELSSDAGFLPPALADQELGLTAALAAAIDDLRDPNKVGHDVLSLWRERIFLLAAGYEDAHDAQQLRDDPLLKLAVGKSPAAPRLAQNRTLHRLSEGFQVRRALAYTLRRRHQGARTPGPRVYRCFAYRAGSWSQEERVVIKTEVTQGALNPRFVVTNLTAEQGWTPRGVYQFYCRRGNPENRIKEFENDLKADRLSCEMARANQFRLRLHVAAYHLFQSVQDHLEKLAPQSEWARAQVGTLREKLLKVAARVRVRCRTTRVQLPSCYPWQELWARLVEALQARTAALGCLPGRPRAASP
jgi:hypothetical protein